MIFSIFDIIVFTIFLTSSLMGLYRGMIYILINFLGFIASIFFAIFLYPYVRMLISGYIANALLASIGSGIASYVFSLIVFTFLSSKVVLLFKGISCGWIDRFLGAIIGTIRGGVICLLIFLVLSVFTTGIYSEAEKSEDIINNLETDKYPQWLKDSVSTVSLQKGLKMSLQYIPESLLNSIELPKDNQNKIDEIKKRKQKERNSEIETPIDQFLEKGINDILPSQNQ
jgi:membrane protein required for colicin V production